MIILCRERSLDKVSEYYDMYLKQCKNFEDGMNTALKVVDIYSTEEIQSQILIDFIQNGMREPGFPDTSKLEFVGRHNT